MRNKAIVVVLIGAAAAGGYWYFNQTKAPTGPQAGPAGPARPVAVETAKAEAAPMARVLTAVGTLLSDESVVIRPEIAGRVKAFNFEEGAKAAKGQVLVRLDDASPAADLVKAQANLGLSKANAERAVRLAGQGAGTQRAKDEAEAKVRVDAAEVEQARAQLEKTVLIAPFSGIVGLRSVSPGAYVQPGQEIVNLEAIDPLKAEFRIPEVNAPLLKVGQSVELSSDSHPGRTFQGKIYAIDPAVDQAGRSVAARAKLDNADGALRPGQFVRIAVKVDEKADAVTIPEEALVPRGQQMIVFKVVDGAAQPSPVKTGRRNSGRVEILQGIAAGEVVVTAGQMKLRPGAPVAPAKSGSGS